jgi:hypothetical protein
MRYIHSGFEFRAGVVGVQGNIGVHRRYSKSIHSIGGFLSKLGWNQDNSIRIDRFSQLTGDKACS